MSAAAAPYKIPRLASLFLSFAFGIVALALQVDALVKGNKEKNRIKGLVPKGTEVDIDTHDVVTAGAVVAAFSAALGVVSLLALALLSTAKRGPSLASRTLPLQGLLLSIVTLGLFGSLVAMTDFVANGEANVTASVGGVPILPAIVHTIENAIGATSVYHEIDYLRLAVILPWFAFLFGTTSSVLTLLAAARSVPEDTEAMQDTASDSTGAELAHEKKRNVNVAQTSV